MLVPLPHTHDHPFVALQALRGDTAYFAWRAVNKMAKGKINMHTCWAVQLTDMVPHNANSWWLADVMGPVPQGWVVDETLWFNVERGLQSMVRGVGMSLHG